MTHTTSRLLVIGILFFCIAATSAQQTEKPPEQEEVLRLKTELLEIRAVVTDKQNRPVEGLKKEDFELLENGRPQGISFFSEQQIKQRINHAVSQPNNPPT